MQIVNASPALSVPLSLQRDEEGIFAKWKTKINEWTTGAVGFAEGIGKAAAESCTKLGADMGQCTRRSDGGQNSHY
jgi:hypothetical protein